MEDSELSVQIAVRTRKLMRWDEMRWDEWWLGLMMLWIRDYKGCSVLRMTQYNKSAVQCVLRALMLQTSPVVTVTRRVLMSVVSPTGPMKPTSFNIWFASPCSALRTPSERRWALVRQSETWARRLLVMLPERCKTSLIFMTSSVTFGHRKQVALLSQRDCAMLRACQ